MTVSPAILLTMIALAATLVARRGIAAAARRSSVAARLKLFYGLIGLLLALRLLYTVWTNAPVAVAMMIAAAWLPVAALWLAEELVRRHAARMVKIMALGGAVAFTILAITVGLVWSEAAIIALATFQSLAIVAVITLLLRGRRDISLAERQTSDLFTLALLLAMPLVITDFRYIFPGLPVRGGSFAVLILVLATSRLVVGEGRPRQLFADIALTLGAGGVAALALSALSLADAQLLPIIACAVAGAALLLLIERFARDDASTPDLLAALAAVDHRRSVMLTAHPLLERGVVVEGESLADYPPAVVERLAEHRLVSGAMARHAPLLGEAASDLLDRYAASHLLRLSQQPPRFLAISASGLAETGLDEELELAARLIEGAA